MTTFSSIQPAAANTTAELLPSMAAPAPRTLLVGESVWFWRHVTNGPISSLQPRPGIIIAVGFSADGSPPPLWLGVIGLGGIEVESAVRFSNEPAADRWSWPDPSWTPAKTTPWPRPEPVVARPVKLSHPLEGQTVRYFERGASRDTGAVNPRVPPLQYKARVLSGCEDTLTLGILRNGEIVDAVHGIRRADGDEPQDGRWLPLLGTESPSAT
jgi:hypothetical protein